MNKPIKYFSGEIFDQLENSTNDLERKRISHSIKTVVGNCTERFIKYYYDGTEPGYWIWNYSRSDS